MLSLSISQMLSSSSSEETSNSNTATSTTTKTATSQSQPASNIFSSSASSSSKPLIAMEEVWKDINLSSITETPNLHQHQQIRSTHHRPSTTSFRPSTNIFQDFLARPFGNEPHISPPQAPTRRTMNHNMASDFSTPVTSNTTAKAKATTRATLFGSLNASSSSCSSPSSPTIPTNTQQITQKNKTFPNCHNHFQFKQQIQPKKKKLNPQNQITLRTKSYWPRCCQVLFSLFRSSKSSSFTG